MQNLESGEALLNITYAGQNGDLPTPILFDSTEADIRRWATEAVRNGIPGIVANDDVNFDDFVVERFAATEGLPPRVILRSKTPFGAVRSSTAAFLGTRRLISSIEASLWLVRHQRRLHGS